VDKETRNEEKTNQWKKNLQDAQNAALDISLGNKGALNQKKAEISTSELDAMEAQINAEERKLELQKRKAELEKKKKEGQ
jgi:regulator of protease activity HflC (stomatin/prohibitin superfamily)